MTIEPDVKSWDDILTLISPDNSMLLETGIKVFDDVLGGLEKFTVIGAPPGSGKSIFTANIYCHNAIQGIPILLFDRENPKSVIWNRIISIMEGMPASFDEINKKFIRSKQPKWFEQFIKNFHLKKNEFFNLSVIEGYVDHIRNETNQDKVLIVLDSLQKLIPTSTLSDRRAGIDTVLSEIEELIDKTGAWMLVVSENSRNYIKGSGVSYGNPTVASYKESGRIEYSARMALALRAKKYLADDDVHTNTALELFMLKENNLAIGGIDNEPIARFTLKYPCVKLLEYQPPESPSMDKPIKSKPKKKVGKKSLKERGSK